MSLAGDILRRAAVSPEQYHPSPVTVKRKPAVTPISNRNLHMARVPGCQRLPSGWEVTACDGERAHRLGCFETMPRARISWRLWQLWKHRGFNDIPTGTTMRNY